MTLFIEELPRTATSPVYTTELTEPRDIQAWVWAHCDRTKRHAVTKHRGGPTLFHGIQAIGYFSWDSEAHRPRKKIFECEKVRHGGYVVFSNEHEATAHYKACMNKAQDILDQKQQVAMAALNTLRAQGIDVQPWVSILDDSGLQMGLCIDHTLDGFTFTRYLES